MKKLKTISLIVCASLLLIACGNDKNTESQSQFSQVESSSTTISSTETSSQSGEAGNQDSKPSVKTVEELTSGPESPADLTAGYKIIANKKHFLPKDYAPGEDPTAASQIRQVIQDMQAQGFSISDSYSGFRTYEYQEQLYQGYVTSGGVAEADRYSARPGYSEHQTGLAFDLINGHGQLLGETDPADEEAVKWIHAHAADYGFVLRYLPGKENITGYAYEAWHLRYVGEDAKAIYNSGLTLEEYYGVTGGDYANN